jgi:hypothetical protein
MSKKKRISPTTIFIACEGRNSEYIYFERIREQIEDDDVFALTVYPDKNESTPKTDVIGLIKEAQARINDFDEVWVVYDKDGYTKHKEAFDLANTPHNGKTVQIAFSSIAFEHWVLLHYEKNNNSFLKADCKTEDDKPVNCGTGQHPKDCMGARCVAGHLRAMGHYPGYAKKANIDIYTTIKNKIPVALENAAWLRHRMQPALAGNPFFNLNPFTDVDVLLKNLLRIEEQYIWKQQGQAASIQGVDISFAIAGTQIDVTISNNSAGAVVLNQFILGFWSDDVYSSLQFANRLIEPAIVINETYNSNTPVAVGKCEFANTHIYFET